MHGYTRWTAFREAGLWIAAIPVLMPVYFVAVTAFKTSGEAAGSPFAPPSSPTTANLSQAWEQAGGGTVSFGQALFNSVLTTLVVVLLLIVTAAPAGYALARRTSRLSGALSGLFMLAMIMPIQLGVIPLYVFLVDAGLAGTRVGLILVYLGLQTPLAVFLYAGFVRGLPTAYEEAARVDGASSLRILAQIVFPLVRPVTGVVAVLTGLFVWNDFFVALVVVGGTDRVTLPVAVYSLVGRFSADWPLIFASTLIALAPVLAGFAFVRRTVMKGFVSTLRG
ncbi:carbohydrate ABC transporter permease [Actinomadura sp. WMMA1423]|uniref:carbohydrate ABC transporter permease n=1 Tax=Actinomadura sp. WMMA1423 TaxID=2591108 RepID=UPI001146CE6C|nr:carbohydrate ABC transporter permease [Actinomadura sp. WMMA1423]